MFPAFTHQPKADYKSFICSSCGYIYSEQKGCPETKIPAGLRWHNLPDDWECPQCDNGKDEFEVLTNKK